MKKILSLDGGGIRGIIPATILTEIEQRTNTPISKLFDLIAGTSTGGIIALGLTTPDEKGKPAYSAEDLVHLYEEDGKNIFYQSLWHRINTFNNLVEPKYPATSIDRILKRYFKDTQLKDALTEVLVMAYEIERRDSFFFKSTKAKKYAHRNCLMRHAARATSAAPTYFSPQKTPTDDIKKYYALIDGGVFANNPAMCAYVEAKTMFPEEEDFLLLSLGTGELTRPIYYNQAKEWGVIQWARPILNVVFDGIADTVDYQLKHLLPTTSSGQKRYYRLQLMLDRDNDDLDNVEEANIRALKLYAEGTIREQSELFDSLCEQLIKR